MEEKYVALIKCPECGKEISGTVKYCPNCVVKIKKQNSITDKAKTKNYIVLAVSIILIIIAISLVVSSEFKYYLDNIDYYTEQYENAKSHSSGFLGGSYASLASKWKDMRDEAIMYVALHSIGAIALSIGGGVGLYRGLKKIKNAGEKSNGAN